MKNDFILESLASDLKRVALGLHRGSTAMAERFSKEALERKKEVNVELIDPYMKELLIKMEKALVKSKDNEKKAEDALMYSTLIQNYIQHQKHL